MYVIIMFRDYIQHVSSTLTISTNLLKNKLMKLKKGTKVKFNGEIIYYQDFSTWKHDFGNKIFYFVKQLNNGIMIFESEGYGLKHDYGSGRIFIYHPLCFKNKIIIERKNIQ